MHISPHTPEQAADVSSLLSQVKAEAPALQGVFAMNQASALKQEIYVKEEVKTVVVKPERPPEPVSKWSLADYDEDAADADKCV